MPRTTKVKSIVYNKLWETMVEKSCLRFTFFDEGDELYDGTNSWDVEYEKICNLIRKEVEDKPNRDVLYLKRLKEVMYDYHNKPITWEKICKAIHISDTTFAAMKRQDNINLATINKLCLFLRCQPEDIMEYIGDADESTN